MNTGNYRFEPQSWPPPDDRRNNHNWLFGFDEDMQPYIVKWEDYQGSRGWVAATLTPQKSGSGTAVPRHYRDDDVDKLMKYWADAPLTKKTERELRDGTFGDHVIRYAPDY